jgi:formate C-acetyltransferase
MVSQVTQRISKLKELSFDYDRIRSYIPYENLSFAPDPEDPPKIRHAKAFVTVMEQCSVNDLPYSTLAGFGGDKFVHRPEHLLKEELETIRNYPSGCSEDLLVAMEESMFYIWAFPWGHISPGYERILKFGISGILDMLQKRLEDTSLNSNQSQFLHAAILEWNGILTLTQRYADLYLEKATKAADEDEYARYQTMHMLISKVPRNPAESFREALQSVWFIHMCTQFDDVSNHSFGRFDQYIYPYYKHDIETGILTENEAREVFYEFWLKFTPGYKITEVGTRDYTADIESGVGPRNGNYWMSIQIVSEKHTDDGQTMDICGLDQDGNDATNAVSHLILDAITLFRTYEPKPVIQYTKKTDPELMKKCFFLNADGHGHPAITYYDSTIKGLRRDPVYSEEDVRNHCHIGCVEIAIAAKSYTDPMNGFVNLPKILLATSYNGKTGGRKNGLVLDIPATFDDFMKNFYSQLQYFLDLYVGATNEVNLFCNQYYSRPLISAIIDNCIEKAIPVDEGGSKYWAKSINCCGLGTLVDSLYAIKKIVFDEKSLSMEAFAKVLEENFVNDELLRQRIVNTFPKYGNGIAEVDILAKEIVEQYCTMVKSKKTFTGNHYRPGLYSFYGPVRSMGESTGATPNGRKSGTVISLNSAPDHGAIQNGLSAALTSVTSFDHTLADNASVLDLHLSGRTPPNVIEYIHRYLSDKDILYAQFSVVDHAQLIDAQKHPEKYPDLTVRVTGFSARFTMLDRETQNEIIARSFWN